MSGNLTEYDNTLREYLTLSHKPTDLETLNMAFAMIELYALPRDSSSFDAASNTLERMWVSAREPKDQESYPIEVMKRYYITNLKAKKHRKEGSWGHTPEEACLRVGWKIEDCEVKLLGRFL